MHPSQMSGFRKTIIALLTISFAGALLIFTAQANLDLLRGVYPNPQFYMFGLLALEGGVVYWTGYYLLHLHGIHKGLAVFALAVDSILSGTGFFYEMESVTKSVGTISLPPVVVIVAFAVVFNVAMSIISHLIPYSQGTTPQPKEVYYQDDHQSRRLEQTSSKGPGLTTRIAASVVDAGMTVGDLVQEKRQQRQQNKQTQVIHHSCDACGTPAAAKVGSVWYCQECLDKIAENTSKPLSTAKQIQDMNGHSPK